MNDTAKNVTTMPRSAPAITFDQQVRLAESFAQSGLFGVKTADQALSLMALCEAEGLHPAIAIRDYHIIQGAPALKADAMLARFQAAGGKVKWTEMTDERVAGEFSHPSGGALSVDWDTKRAVQAGLAGKDNWKKYPRQMRRARVISEGIRAVFPGVIAGLYTPEEVEDFDVAPPPPKDVTPPKPETYSDEAFKENLPKWRDLMENKGKTPEGIIATVGSKYALTDDQKQQIRNLKSEPSEYTPGDNDENA